MLPVFTSLSKFAPVYSNIMVQSFFWNKNRKKFVSSTISFYFFCVLTYNHAHFITVIINFLYFFSNACHFQWSSNVVAFEWLSDLRFKFFITEGRYVQGIQLNDVFTDVVLWKMIEKKSEFWWKTCKKNEMIERDEAFGGLFLQHGLFFKIPLNISINFIVKNFIIYIPLLTKSNQSRSCAFKVTSKDIWMEKYSYKQ